MVKSEKKTVSIYLNDGRVKLDHTLH